MGFLIKFALILSLGAIYAITFALMPIWEGIWTNILNLRIDYLGYVFLAFSILGIVGVFLSNVRKHPARRNFFLVMAIFAMIIALDLIFRDYFVSVWFA